MLIRLPPTRYFRILSQGLFLALFAGSLAITHHPIQSGLLEFLPVNFMLRIDPLVGTVVMGSMRLMIQSLLAGAITLLVSIALGRVFCGWVCPLGSLFDLYGWFLRRFRIPFEGPSPRWYRLKFYLLLAILTFAALGFFSPLIGLDPIVLLTRFVATVIAPLGRMIGLGYPTTPLAPHDFFWNVGSPLPTFGSLFDTLTGLLILAIFIGTTRLSRIWCRAVCPLGAYLGTLSRFSVLRRKTDQCVHCHICSRHCPTGAIDFKNPEFYTESECIKCFACSQECPVDANFFGLTTPFPAATSSYAPVELERRHLLGTVAAAMASTPFLHFSGGEARNSKKLLRPPMSREEHDFLSSCIRCGECMKACPTGVLKPAGVEHGVRALWTPILRTDLSFCLEGCNACSVACPTDAILKYPVEQKYSYKAGTAIFDPGHCVSHVENKFCSECVKVCPTQAIAVQPGWKPDSGLGSDSPAPEGKLAERPTVIMFDRCIGCGACENACHQVVLGPSAMEVTSAGRARPSKL